MTNTLQTTLILLCGLFAITSILASVVASALNAFTAAVLIAALESDARSERMAMFAIVLANIEADRQARIRDRHNAIVRDRAAEAVAQLRSEQVTQARGHMAAWQTENALRATMADKPTSHIVCAVPECGLCANKAKVMVRVPKPAIVNAVSQRMQVSLRAFVNSNASGSN